MAQWYDTPTVVPGFTLYMSSYFGRIGAAFCSAYPYILFGDAFPVLQPGATTLAGPARISMNDFYFHSISKISQLY
ncbi:hypothetical protein [Ekhidna sp.]|uniref:hypothetical protein n=1 Tax=Ekhidna sp. TaxID=2608089 RepID=UPI0032EC0F0D